ncbi:MAG: bifunctional phosphoribosylaminoimidazolecarboxamide formyltransferase/IMP cyclohydrolase [Thermoplasmata archaeon]|nr:bifunctional phosphoribosylaminoimidazolecarboxamide formyltransferase/IMP cyclohydrolase [Thermoplasmata archaeon]
MAPEATGRIPVRRALVAVDDKRALPEFARELIPFGIELWATSGTLKALSAAGVAAQPAEQLTGIADWFGGRVKTLHPGVLGGVLAPATAEGSKELKARGLLAFDLVVVNFYPFEARARERPTDPGLVDSIDIGGVTLARAAAKNHARVAAISDPEEYPVVAAELAQLKGHLSAELRRALAARTFLRVEAYDRAIARAFTMAESAGTLPGHLEFEREETPLRYGENPHQAAARYVASDRTAGALTPLPLRILKGASLSYTNLLDLETALSVVAEFPTPTAAVVKHATPVGVASGLTPAEAVQRALATDPVARYGCVLALNRPFDAATSAELHGVFVDLLAAPSFAPEVMPLLERRSKLKVLEVTPPAIDQRRWEGRTALGRLLLQEYDLRQLAPGELRPVTGRTASPEERCALDFAWRVVRHARSNAVVIARGSATVGIGSGQPSRVKAVEDAVAVAGDRARGAVLASDAFFPFADGIEAAGRGGVAAILQPGGSVRDAEVIAAAERLGIAMFVTGWRVFRH